jgi:hypothetical protein
MAAQSQTDDSYLSVHGETYHRFMLGVKWFAIGFAAVAVSLTLWFATPAGFLWGLVTGVAIFAIGAYAMTHGLAHSSESADLPEPRPQG